MSHRVLLLPDVIGHPICFLQLIPELSSLFDCKVVNYHHVWPYANIDELVDKISTNLNQWIPDWVIGYSFGGLVAYEAIGHFCEDARLLLIDSHLFDLEHSDSMTIDSKRIKLPIELQRLSNLLEQMGEVNRECIWHNLNVFPRYLPHRRLKRAVLLHCERSTYLYKSAHEWGRYIDAMEHYFSAASHETVLSHKESIATILHILERE